MSKYVNGDRAWLILIGLVLTYELTCREGELLSEAVDRFLLRHPFLTRFLVIQTALHLLNVYDAAPERFQYLDIYRAIFLARKPLARKLLEVVE